MRYEDRDREDSKWRDEGNLAALLATYYPIVRGRCYARIQSGDAEDVAQNVMLRIVGEWEAGKRWDRIPFRVVVHQIIGWTVGEYFQGLSYMGPLPEDWDAGAPDWTDAVHDRDLLMRLFDELSPREQEIATLHYIESRGAEEIASELGSNRNAIDQALYRIRAKLRRVLTSP